MKTRLALPAATLLLLPLAACSPSQRPEDVAVEKVVGAPVRVVWGQDTTAASDPIMKNGTTRIMAYDSADGRGERVLIPGPTWASKPLLSPDGNTVVFTDQKTEKIYTVPFDGSAKPSFFVDGYGLEVWQEPGGPVWVIVGSAFTKGKYSFTSTRITRHRLDDPGVSEAIWTSDPVHADNFQLSRDGGMASALFPWPKAGRLVTDGTEDHTWQRFGRGCWVSMAPDDSRVSWVFDGAHKYVEMTDGTAQWKVDVHRIPGNKGYEVYHPRWSNHPRFLAVSGPYKAGKGANQIREGGKDVEIFVGRFNAKATEVETWARITRNTVGDFYPDVWIKGGGQAQLDRPQVHTQASAAVTDTGHQGALFSWEHAARENRLSKEGSFPATTAEWELKDFAHFSPRHGLWFPGNGKSARAFAAVEPERAKVLQSRTHGRLGFWICVGAPPKNGSALARISLGDGKESILGIAVRPNGDLGIMVDDTYYAAGDLRLTPQTPAYLSLQWTPERLTLTLNGAQRGGTRLDNPVDLSTVSHIHAASTDRPMELLELEVLGGSDHDPGPARARAAKRYAARPDPQWATVQAKVIASSTVPDPEDLGTYRRCLVSTLYQTVKVVDGVFEEEEFVANRWAIMDRKVVSPAPKEGETVTLRLTLFDDEALPQLKGERVVNTIEDVDLLLPYLEW